jgi:hypothetical protein
VSVTSEKKSKSRPHALNTVELLKHGSSYLGISPSECVSHICLLHSCDRSMVNCSTHQSDEYRGETLYTRLYFVPENGNIFIS